jgi:hypothetical protein
MNDGPAARIAAFRQGEMPPFAGDSAARIAPFRRGEMPSPFAARRLAH